MSLGEALVMICVNNKFTLPIYRKVRNKKCAKEDVLQFNRIGGRCVWLFMLDNKLMRKVAGSR